MEKNLSISFLIFSVYETDFLVQKKKNPNRYENMKHANQMAF